MPPEAKPQADEPPRPPRWVCFRCLKPVVGEVYFTAGRPAHKGCLPPARNVPPTLRG